MAQNTAFNNDNETDEAIPEVKKSLINSVEIEVTKTKPKKKERAKYEDYIELLKSEYPEKPPKRCILDGLLKVYRKGQWLTVTEKGSVVLDRLESYCRDNSNFYSYSGLLCHYRKFEDNLTPEYIVDDLPKWDRKDRIKLLSDSLNALYLSKDATYELLKNWLILAYKKATAKTPPQEQNHILVLQGQQGIGKDEFIDTLIAPFKPYTADLAIRKNMDATEWARLITKKVIVKISELDQTKGSEAIIKDILTKKEATYRKLYKEGQTTEQIRGSMVASINPKNIVNDPTGARRFLVIELKGKPFNKFSVRDKLGYNIDENDENITFKKPEKPAIDWDLYKDAKNQKQLLAQIIESSKTWDSHKNVSAKTWEQLEKIQKRLTPMNDSTEAIRDLFSLFLNDDRYEQNRELTNKEIKEIDGQFLECYKLTNEIANRLIKEIKEIYSISDQKIRSELKCRGFIPHQPESVGNGKKRRHIYIPVNEFDGFE